MGDWEWTLTIQPQRKGGPGSGNWGHAGRPGQVGGSAPGGGAAYAREKYLKTIRDGYPRPVRDEIAAKVQALRPDATGHQVYMYLDVMSMDQERFLYYAEKIGMKNPKQAMEAYFAENDAVEKDVMRRRWALEEAATYSQKGQSKEALAAYGEIWDRYHDVREGTATELTSALKDRYGVTIQNDSGVSDETIRTHASYLLNLADAHPAIGAILKEQVETIRYKDRRPGETTTASWQFGAVEVKDPKYTGPAVLAHELGYAADN